MDPLFLLAVFVSIKGVLMSEAPQQHPSSNPSSRFFLNIPESIATHPGLHRNSGAKLVYGALKAHCRHKDRCRVRWGTLAAECGLSRRTVARALSLLEELRIIQRLAVWVDGTKGRNRDRAASYYVLLPISDPNLTTSSIPCHDDTTPCHDDTPGREVFEDICEESKTCALELAFQSMPPLDELVGTEGDSETEMQKRGLESVEPDLSTIPDHLLYRVRLLGYDLDHPAPKIQQANRQLLVNFYDCQEENADERLLYLLERSESTRWENGAGVFRRLLETVTEAELSGKVLAEG